MFSPLTKQLIDALRCLPSVGPKSAQRMAFQLLSTRGQPKGLALADVLQRALTQVQQCQQCRVYTESSHCDICAHPKRDQGLLCVVETPADVVALEQTSSYQGLYFILHGHLSPLDGIGPSELGIPDLLTLISTLPIREMIIATNPTMEGKATAHYIASQIDTTRIACSRIAHGVPMGGELEYLDGGTLAHALSSRVPITN